MAYIAIVCCVQTDEDWQHVRSGKVGCDLDKVHNKLVKKEKSKFLEDLKKTGGYLYFQLSSSFRAPNEIYNLLLDCGPNTQFLCHTLIFILY